MKRNIIITVILFVTSTHNFAQNGGIEGILQSVEENNKELQANKHLIQSKKLEDKSDNNLSNPSVSYEYMFGSPRELGKSGELEISQEFDFPTVYGTRGKLNKMKATSYDKQFQILRRDILLQAKDICLDLILLNQQNEVLNYLFDNAHQLSAIYEERLQSGDANILEVNKVKMELIKVQTEVMENEAQRQTKLQELAALNGGLSIDFAQTTYAAVPDIVTYGDFKDEFLVSDLELQSLDMESEVARKQISVNRAGWLPKLQVGYRHDNGAGEQFNGFLVGASIPLFENKNKVKAAKAQSAFAELQKKNVEDQLETTIQASYLELQKIKGMMAMYNIPLLDSSMELLKKALDAREISMTNYFAEITTVYESRQNYMQLQNRYQKIMAQLYKNRL